MKPYRHYPRWIAPSVLALSTLFARPVHAEDLHPPLRPPAVPLVTFDPYLSIWSEADRLADDVTRHWTHRPHSLVSLIRIDGKAYRLMGNTPAEVPALPQTGLQVLPTRSIYEFESANVHVTLTFMTPALPHDLDVLARPLSYITWNVHSTDGANHAISLYDSASGELAVNTPDQRVWGKHETAGKLEALRIGTEEQTLLSPMGDDVRIDWGYAYLAAPAAQCLSAINSGKDLEEAFVTDGKLFGDDTHMPRPANVESPTLAFMFDLGQVGTAPVARHVMVAYDELYAIKYFGKKLRPYWRRNGMTPAALLQAAERDYSTLTTRCAAFDRELMADADKVGGWQYAQIIALAYRQTLAGCGLAADANRQPLWFTKENTSNGDLATVDVIFPMVPMPLLFSPTLAKASLVSVLDYAASSHWKFPNAPHDLGTYPVAMGRDDGGEGMPVEESGNMLLMCDAIARMEGSPAFAVRYWPQLSQWEKYLEQYGNDPENQLCTDDFMGHLAHNANLSVKAILAIAAYGDLCRMRGDSATADRLQALARQYALHWVQVAGEGDHFRLAFDRPHTWSQKYNLVWDKILGLNVFPPSVAQTEFAYYKSVMQPYGVPLDSRTRLTKTDWTFWSATLADSKQDFESLIAPVYAYLNQTTAHSPLADSYITDDIKSDGMHARPVVGGLFVKMLADPQMWKKWSRDEQTKGIGNWAALPTPPTVASVVPTSEKEAADMALHDREAVRGVDTAGFRRCELEERAGRFRHGGDPRRGHPHGLEHGRYLDAPHIHHACGQSLPSPALRLP